MSVAELCKKGVGSGLAVLALSGIFGCTAARLAKDSALDASAWREVGAPVWRFERDGVAAGPSAETGYIVSKAAFDDFRLTVEFRVEDDTNSGIFLRCTNPRELSDLNPVDCYEVNIWDNHPNQDFRTGSIVGLVTPSVRVDTLGQWNTYSIDVRGASVTVTLNGQQTARLSDERLASGYIALQYAGGGRLRFRNLEIELD